MLLFKFTQFALVPSQHDRQRLHKIVLILQSPFYTRHDVTLEKQTVMSQLVNLMYHSLDLLPGVVNLEPHGVKLLTGIISLTSKIEYLVADITVLFMDFSYLLPDFINLTIEFLIHIFAMFDLIFYGIDIQIDYSQPVAYS